MVLKPNEIRIFEHMRSIFKWVPWEAPFQWGSTYSQIERSTSKIKNLPFCINMVFTFAIGFLSITVVVFKSTLFPHVPTAQVVICGIVFALAVAIVIAIVIVMTSDTLFYGINQTLSLCHRTLYSQRKYYNLLY